MTDELHSKYSASNASGWMRCAGRIAMCRGLPNTSSVYADEGTAGHELAKWCLEGWSPEAHAAGDWPLPTSTFEGRVIEVGEREFTVDDDMVRDVQLYVDNIAEYAVGADAVLTEVRVNYSRVLAVPRSEAWGTSDVVILKQSEIQTHDLKYGRGEEVEAEENEQCQLYALGAKTQFDGLAADYDVARLVIHQVRKSPKPKEFDMPMLALDAFGVYASERVNLSMEAQEVFDSKVAVSDPGMTQEEWEKEYLTPGEKQCRWCLAKATCGERRRSIAQGMGESNSGPASVEDFADLDTPEAVSLVTRYRESVQTSENDILSKMMFLAPEVESWITAVRAEMERRLLNGVEFADWKIVQGRRGHRAWTDEREAEKLMKSFRLKMEEMYKMTVISPTQAEKLGPPKVKRGKPVVSAKTVIGAKQWAKLQELITQSEGGKHVAPATDEREAIKVTPIAEDFPDLGDADSEQPSEHFSDLA